MMLGRSIVLSLLLLLMSAAGAVQTPIAMHHTSWTAREGAPQMAFTMTQTRDGWLWLGGSTGLFRFDGVRFERYTHADHALPSLAVGILTAFDDGSLWIGNRYGGISVLSNGKLRNYDEKDGLPVGSAVWGIERDGNGRTWAATNSGIFYLDGVRWLAAGASFGLPLAPFKTLFKDRQGTLWAQGNEGVYQLLAKEGRFVKAGSESGTGVLFQLLDGSVWSWNAVRGAARRLTQPTHGVALESLDLPGELGSLLVDRQGGIWAGRLASVEYRTAHGTQRTSLEQGLSGQWVSAIFEDREGSIWTATSTGIDRFRHQRISAVHRPGDANFSSAPLVADAGGGVWIGAEHLAQGERGAFTSRPLSLKPPVRAYWPPTASYLDPAGVLWFAGNGYVLRKKGRELRSIAAPANSNLGLPSSLASDDGGALWVLWLSGMFRLDASGRWQDMVAETGLDGEVPRVLGSSPQQGLWLGYARSRVLQWQGGRWRRYGPPEGLAVGMVDALHVKDGHVWAGGDRGVALRQGDRFIPLVGIDGRAFESVSGILEVDGGDLWLDTGGGLARIPAGEIRQLEAAPGHRVRYELLDSLDGLSGNVPVRYPLPTMVQAADQKLWLSTASGVYTLDPAERLPLPLAATVLISSLGPPGQLTSVYPGMRLPQQTTALQIDYTALALAMPERVKFRYRLDGVDTGWQEVGTRRTAYYNNLGPGNYSFRVEASNYAGEWGARPTTLDFSIAPTIPQSWWFKTLCGLLLLVSCGLLYRWRVQSFAAQAVARSEGRTRERERIARELHDTLLQSVQALILHMHVATLKMPPPDPARLMIEQALLQAEDVMTEGRARVRDLRHNQPAQQDLVEAITTAGTRVCMPGTSVLQVQVEGEVRALHPAIYEEVLSIASEAVSNAYRHADASRIDVQLCYRATGLRLTIRDDGGGIPADVIAAGGRVNHWGISGMHERAARIKAKLALRSEPGGGTEWCLALRAALAYQVPPRRWWSWRRNT